MAPSLAEPSNCAAEERPLAAPPLGLLANCTAEGFPPPAPFARDDVEECRPSSSSIGKVPSLSSSGFGAHRARPSPTAPKSSALRSSPSLLSFCRVATRFSSPSLHLLIHSSCLLASILVILPYPGGGLAVGAPEKKISSPTANSWSSSPSALRFSIFGTGVCFCSLPLVTTVIEF